MPKWRFEQGQMRLNRDEVDRNCRFKGSKASAEGGNQVGIKPILRGDKVKKLGMRVDLL